MEKNKHSRSQFFVLVVMLALLAALGNPVAAAAAGNGSDIAVTLVADRNTVRAGQTVTYTLTATNLGPDDAVFVDFAFQLPAQMVLVSMSCDLGISPDGPFCEYSSLPAGATVVSKLVARPRPRSHSRLVTTSVSTLFENLDSVDPDLANNTASVKTRLTGRPSQP